MSRIHSKDTKSELIVRRFLYSQGFRYRVNLLSLPGKPDIVFIKRKIAIFINGCFFHRHTDCPKATSPKTRELFWIRKIDQNVKRDERNIEKLREMGWLVFVVWECQLEPKKNASSIRLRTLELLIEKIVRNDTCN